eukprot:563842-Pelagomonas_calceolata.AAC.1
MCTSLPCAPMHHTGAFLNGNVVLYMEMSHDGMPTFSACAATSLAFAPFTPHRVASCNGEL